MSKARKQSKMRAFQRGNDGTPNSSKISPSTARGILKNESSVVRNYSKEQLKNIAEA